ncbi:MAG: hypothetical protein ABWW69_04970 [Pyrodictiaceae archaeon]
MRFLKLPPRIKVLEAAGAIADGRVHKISKGMAKVVSSEGDKVYRVFVDPDQGVAYSDDNGTRLRGYIGYPIIAVMMSEGLVSLDEDIASSLKGIPWKKLNEKFKKYAMVEAYVKKIAAGRGISPSRIDEYVTRVMRELSRYKLRRLDEPPLGL